MVYVEIKLYLKPFVGILQKLGTVEPGSNVWVKIKILPKGIERYKTLTC